MLKRQWLYDTAPERLADPLNDARTALAGLGGRDFETGTVVSLDSYMKGDI